LLFDVQKLTKPFLYSTSALLLITGLAKLISVFGKANLLEVPDPITKIQFRYLLLVIGIVEIVIAVVCFLPRRTELKAALIALLATNFALYRIGLFLMHYHRPCACLGGLTDAIGIPSATADMIMKCILVYFLVGSYGILFNRWLNGGNVISQVHS